ncbi:hypothetical protein SLUN_28720 [Streptomyces lunaelactis]|uniref:DUF4190 domain-containing protein n=2 Tax=Streptomyces lunaelactis TaxID=1535768 RepID=A0A2R4T8Z4_9ACTN|nr:DUF4190 domain-containing protein [Streptomyces lunaelactis]AVZ75596.1 hypothetical protein SLUN_28720 [Streptomyces lunaelactis]
MSDNQAQPPGGPEPRDRDPWAPPESSAAQSGAAQDKVPLDKPVAPVPPSATVHDQMTVTSMPSAGPVSDTGAVPPPPIAPGGPAQPAAGPYGYPAPPSTPQPAPFGHAPAADPYGGGYPGYPAYQGGYNQGWQPAPANGMGITAMVLGIIATVLFCFYGLGIILGILALIFGFIGRGRAQRGEATNGGMALAGIILGAIGTVISSAFIGFIIWAIANDDFDSTNDDPWSNTLVVDVSR